jgi:hypothetical protein
MAKRGRNYAQEEKLNDTPEQRARQAARMRARRKAEKEGKVSKHDGKEVDHKDFNPNNNSPSNLRVLSAKENRSRQPKRKKRD